MQHSLELPRRRADYEQWTKNSSLRAHSCNFSDICKTGKAKFKSSLNWNCKMPTNTQANLVFAKLFTVLTANHPKN